MDQRYYTFVYNDLKTKIDDTNSAIEDFSERIIELDNQKAAYDAIIYSIDLDVLSEIDTVNSKILEVGDVYQERINVGCRTDVFWRKTAQIGTSYTLVATQLSLAGYAGTLPTVEYFNGSGFSVADIYDKFGYVEENAYAIKYYDEPVTKDIGDTFVASFVGTINSGSDQLTVLSVVGSSSTVGINTGQLVVSSKDGVLTSSTNIIGIGTTALSQTILGITTGSVVTVLSLDSSAVGFASAPESDGSYVTFTVLSSVTEFGFDEYEIESEKDPSSPQTIGIVTSGTLGIGVSVIYNDSGGVPNTVSWYPELVDEEDPNTSEPSVGSGFYYLKVGFSSYPISLSGQRVPIGFVTTVTLAELTGITSIASSCPTQETNLNNAISNLNIVKSEISSGINTLNYKIDVSNTFREQRKEIQSEIWTLGQQIAGYNGDLIIYQNAINYLGVTTITDIIL